MGIWVYGYTGYMVIQCIGGIGSIWVYEYMGIWVYGYMGIWVYGYMRYMGMWECVGGWSCDKGSD